MAAAQALCLAGVAASAIYYWLTWLACLRLHARKTREDVPASAPAVTLIIPLKSGDPFLERNLSCFCALDYPSCQIIFALESRDDPAFGAASKIAGLFPKADVSIVVCASRTGLNPKENNHANAYTRAKHDWIVLADADVVAAPDYLRRVTAPLQDPGVGLVTCPYRFIGQGSFWSTLKALAIHASFAPSVMLAAWLAPVRFGIGATLAFKREALEKIGGFPAVAEYLASDFWLANKISRAGYRALLIPYWLDIQIENLSWRDYLRYQLRWVRTMRQTTPWGFAGTLATHGLFWALGLLALRRADALSWLIVAVVQASRVLTCVLIWNQAGIARLAGSLFLLPVHDLLATGFWLAAFSGNRVHWAGRVFKIGEGTRIKE